ncbi:MAG TPA: NAD-dependent epimerase/dehydratase family protein, partial [Phycisphaerae bacterium]
VCTYGDTQHVIPTTESSPQNPTCDYGRHKVACEQTFLQAHRDGKYGKNSGMTILRPSHTFGPGGGIINSLGFQTSFVDRLRRGIPVIVAGDGNGLWATAYADDVGVGFAKILGRAKSFGEHFNIVGDEVVTWDQYIQRSAAALGGPTPKIVHIPTDVLLSIAPKRYEWLGWVFRYHGIYSNEKLRTIVPEYRSATPYAEGVKRTVAVMERLGKIIPAEKDPFEDQLISQWHNSMETLRSLAKPPA